MPADDVVAKKRKRLEWQIVCFETRQDVVRPARQQSVRPLKRKNADHCQQLGSDQSCRQKWSQLQNKTNRLVRQNDAPK